MRRQSWEVSQVSCLVNHSRGLRDCEEVISEAGFITTMYLSSRMRDDSEGAIRGANLSSRALTIPSSRVPTKASTVPEFILQMWRIECVNTLMSEYWCSNGMHLLPCFRVVCL